MDRFLSVRARNGVAGESRGVSALISVRGLPSREFTKVNTRLSRVFTADSVA